jgi:hypothetical protein
MTSNPKCSSVRSNGSSTYRRIASKSSVDERLVVLPGLVIFRDFDWTSMNANNLHFYCQPVRKQMPRDYRQQCLPRWQDQIKVIARQK